jgi:hypothetical protein
MASTAWTRWRGEDATSLDKCGGHTCLGPKTTDLQDLRADQERKNHQSGRVRAYDETATAGLYRFLGAIRRPHAQRGKVYAHVHGRLHAAVMDLSD